MNSWEPVALDEPPEVDSLSDGELAALVRFVDEILAGQGSGWTAQKLRYVCGNPIARAITTFFRGATPC